jgi:hypothetical protein
LSKHLVPAENNALAHIGKVAKFIRGRTQSTLKEELALTQETVVFAKNLAFSTYRNCVCMIKMKLLLVGEDHRSENHIALWNLAKTGLRTVLSSNGKHFHPLQENSDYDLEGEDVPEIDMNTKLTQHLQKIVSLLDCINLLRIAVREYLQV